MNQRKIGWKGCDLDGFNRTLSTTYPEEVAFIETSREPEGEIIRILRGVTQAEVTVIDPSAHMNRTILKAFGMVRFSELLAIDRAIPFPLFFQLIHDGQIRCAASYKRPSDADATKWVIEASFQTEPQPEAAERPPLPVALDLAGLYEQMIRRHLPLPPRTGEGIREHVARFNAIQAREKEQRLLRARLRSEKQFNRKVELNAALRILNAELEILQPCPPPPCA